jgi:hypothetical protein
MLGDRAGRGFAVTGSVVFREQTFTGDSKGFQRAQEPIPSVFVDLHTRFDQICQRCARFLDIFLHRQLSAGRRLRRIARPI